MVVKEYASVMIQFDAEELNNNIFKAEGEVHADLPKTSEQKLFDILKEYAINLVTRSNPTSGKKGYYRVVWEDFSFDDLMDFVM